MWWVKGNPLELDVIRDSKAITSFLIIMDVISLVFLFVVLYVAFIR